MTKKVILLEFNELTHELMEKYFSEGELPNFKELHQKSQVYITDANASGDDLNPWIQWVSVHTGLRPSEHKVYRLNDMDKFDGDFVWDSLSRKGIKSWVCGSMNTKFKSNFKGLFIHDPWATTNALYPAGQFDTYMNFVKQSVQGHSSQEKVPALSFLLYMLRSGLSFKTIYQAGRQLITEQLDKTSKWGRAMILDMFQYDVFRHYYRKERPEFATFFLNSTAHYQHHYWKDADPVAFGLERAGENKRKSKAILSGYKNMDNLLGEFMELADEDTTIMFCTALSQQPYLDEERSYYRIINEKVFFDKIGLKTKVKYSPVMAEQFHLECNSVEEAKALSEWFQNFEMESEKYFYVGSKKVFSTSIDNLRVNVQCRCAKAVEDTAVILDKNENRKISFYDVFLKMDDTKTGVHNPHGMFWVYDRSKVHKVYDKPMHLEEIQPMILDQLGVGDVR